MQTGPVETNPSKLRASHAETDAGRSYRVCFMNRFARGSNTTTACQRTIVIPSATSREAAIEVAKQRFAECRSVRRPTRARVNTELA